MKNRKLFAILTLVAFMLTMMPVMAFATTSNQIGAWVEDGSAKVYETGDVKDANKVVFGIDLPELLENERVYVFATVAGTNEVYGINTEYTRPNGSHGSQENGYQVFTPNSQDGMWTIEFTNTEAIELDLKVVLVKDIKTDSISFTGVTPDTILNKVDSGVEFTYANIAWDADNTVEFVDSKSYDNVITVAQSDIEGSMRANNGVDWVEYTVTVKNEAGTAIKGAEVEVTVNKVGAAVNKDVITTNARGIAKFVVSASKAGTYTINIATDDADDKEINVTFGSAALGSVTAADLTGNFATDEEFQVVLTGTDANGNTLTGAQLLGMLDANRDFKWTQVPEDSGFDTDDAIELGGEVKVGLDQNYNCVLKITPDEEGDYTLKMYNPVTGSGVEYINFSAKDFDEAVSVSVTYGAATYTAGAEIAPPTVVLVDANGTKSYVVRGAKFSYTGVGVVDFSASTGAMSINPDDKFLGKEIVVNVVVDDCFASTTLKIADVPAYLKFTEVTAPVATEATVPVVSLDLNGNVAAIGVLGENVIVTADAVVTSKPAGAVVSVDTAGATTANFAKKGQSAIKIASTKEGTVTANVILEVASYEDSDFTGTGADRVLVDGAEPKNTVYLTGIATVTFGAEKTPVQTSATLIIGSNIFVANGGVQTAPAAPVIIDGRTYLPIRAVGQAIGANVDYADGVITLTLGAQKATMVPGSNVMTVGTETVTMDAAPYLAGDGHTMVPVRYAAQAFGYELGTTTNADGSVATVTVFK